MGKSSSRNPETPMEVIVSKLEETMKLLEAGDLEKAKSSNRECFEFARGLDPYIKKFSSQPPSVLQQVERATQSTNWDELFQTRITQFRLKKEMQTDQVESQMLKMLVHMTRAKKVLEIGMFTGYATLGMAEALPKDGTIVALEIEPFLKEFSQRFFDQSQDGKKISVKLGSALESLEGLAEMGEKFDLIFIDADKAGYLDYYKKIRSLELLSDNGFIVVDNTLMKGVWIPQSQQNEQQKAIAKFNEYISGDSTVEQVVLPVRDGVSIIRPKKPCGILKLKKKIDLEISTPAP